MHVCMYDINMYDVVHIPGKKEATKEVCCIIHTYVCMYIYEITHTPIDESGDYAEQFCLLVHITHKMRCTMDTIVCIVGGQ